MAKELGKFIDIFQISASGENADLHDEYHRRIQPTAEESDKKQKCISDV